MPHMRFRNGPPVALAFRAAMTIVGATVLQ